MQCRTGLDLEFPAEMELAEEEDLGQVINRDLLVEMVLYIADDAFNEAVALTSTRPR